MHGLKPPEAVELVERLRAILEERPPANQRGARGGGASARGGGEGFQVPGEAVEAAASSPASAVAGVRAAAEGLELGTATEAGLAAAVVVELPSAPELALRAAVADVRQALLGLEKEVDPLVRTLGLRSLVEDLQQRGFAPEHLERPEDRAFARQLVGELHAGLRHCLAGLDAQARGDLGTLENAERARRAVAEAVQRREEATAACDGRREDARRAVEDETLAGARLGREARQGAPAPNARRRTSGMALFIVGVLSLLILAAMAVVGAATQATPLRERPVVGLGAGVLVAVAGLVLGAWLWNDPARRFARRRARVERLDASSRDSVARLDESRRELERALALFARVDEECRREEAAVAAVLQRRPGAARYVGAVRRAPSGSTSTALARR